MYVGMPVSIMLDDFGAIVADAFGGNNPYHVGSSVLGTKWRDVDVRLILDDEEYARRFGRHEACHQSPEWVALVRAFSALGKEMTGLPIDFQIQPRSFANARYKGERHALGLSHYFRHHDPEPRKPKLDAPVAPKKPAKKKAR